jgi:hypothetical protein
VPSETPHPSLSFREAYNHADYERWQPIVDTKGRELYVSLGAALENVVVAGQDYQRLRRPRPVVPDRFR